ncbi:tetratricopeptide repeat protein [Pelomonas sp. KK5]|uniref:O-linked N-acetylglucosamine transferase, SPINDLY family protein n=1 Tax=Pelomonas sp. KK5 TaxID=1855730 RepID=UPI0009F842DE|nr:tetratricopeptide repeat protein [Pelomonas sp. KK5]
MTLQELLGQARELLGRQAWGEAVALMAPFAPRVESNPLQRYYGEALRRAGRAQEAIEALMKALALKPDDTDAYLQLAFTFQALAMPEEAAECFRTVALLQPHSIQAQAYQALGDQQAARWEHFDANLTALQQAIAARPEDADDEFAVPFALVALPHDPALLLKAARISSRFLSRGLKPLPPLKATAKPRLRIGYLSADFHAHATAALLVEVLERRDRERFEVLLFSHGPDDGSPQARRIRAACDRFIDVSTLDTAAIAARIHAEEVDIVVDLKGHTADSRFAALARRPAPVQVSWLGFPGSSGAGFIDYIVGDAIVTPLADAPHYSEQIAQLPGCYQPADGTRERTEPPSRAELGLPGDAFVLLGANPVYKITPPVFEAWMEILRRAPRAVLWQLSAGEQTDARLSAEAARRGIEPARLVFMPKTDMATHWRRLAAADLALDTWPCNGHTTSRDVLQAGVPLLALRDGGIGFAGRVAASILAEAGLADWAVDGVDAYIEKAVALANGSAPRPAVAGAGGDAALFARGLEALYLRMWERAAAGLPPAALPAQVTS